MTAQTQPYRSYRDSEAYRRSSLIRADGRPLYPLGFLDRPVPVAAARGRRGLGLIAALLVCAAVAVALERRS